MRRLVESTLMTVDGVTSDPSTWSGEYLKYVFSASLQKTDRNNTTIVRGDVVERVRELKAQPAEVKDMKDAINYFAGELRDAGIATCRRAVLVLLYDRALTAPSPGSWAHFYRALFSSLHLLAHETAIPTVRSHAAIEALLRVVEDDLGSLLFGTAALTRLRASLAHVGSPRPRSAFESASERWRQPEPREHIVVKAGNVADAVAG